MYEIKFEIKLNSNILIYSFFLSFYEHCEKGQLNSHNKSIDFKDQILLQKI